jgi:TonB-dependent starch-binding outer membrane protein SusC
MDYPGKMTLIVSRFLPGFMLFNADLNTTCNNSIFNYLSSANGRLSKIFFNIMNIIPRQRIVVIIILINALFTSSLYCQSDTIVKTSQIELNNGYMMQKVPDISGSVSFVSRTSLVTVPSGNITNQLQGLASGINVIGNGQPGSIAQLRIRGIGAFSGSAPLYVIDGVTASEISFLNPNDVESIAILKDAGEAAIYGARAINGVVVITTRRGTKGIHLNYDMSMGTQLPGKGPAASLLNAQEYASLQWLVYRNDGNLGTHMFDPVYGSLLNDQPTMPKWAANTNWYDAITNQAGMQNQNLSFSDSGKNHNFYVGLGYFKQNGIIIQTFDKRYTAAFNSEFTFLNGRVKLGENMKMAYQSNPEVPNLSEESPIRTGPYGSQPIIPVFITEPITGISHNFVPGEYGGTGISAALGNSPNPVAVLERGRDNIQDNHYLNGNINADVKIIDGLNLRARYGYSMRRNYSLTFSFETYENSENQSNSIVSDQFGSRHDWDWTNLLSFERTFGSHRISLIAGYEKESFDKGYDHLIQRHGDFSSASEYYQLKNNFQISSNSLDSYAPVNITSQFLQADYGFNGKYLLGLTLRRDGVSGLPSASRYNIFPAASVAWRLSKEPFLNKITWLNEGKIRLSYGKTGSLNGSTNLSADIGFDGEFLDRHLGLNFDWYNRKSKNVFFQTKILSGAGIIDSPAVNSSKITNDGIDLGLTYRNKQGEFGFTSSVIFSTYNNRIEVIAPGVTFFDYGNSRIGALSRNMIGEPISVFYGYKVIGLFKDWADVNNSPQQDGAAPGFFKFANTDKTDVDAAGKQVIDPNDKTIIGNPNPKYTISFNLNFTFKNFDLSAFIYGSEGNDIYNFTKWYTDLWPSFRGEKSRDLLYNSWTPNNPDAIVPKASSTSNFSTNTQSTSYYIEDGSYIRLKSLQLGYSISAGLLSRIHVQSLRIYLQTVNLLTLTKYSGMDPEIGGDDRSFGIDFGNYPSAKQFIFGLQLSL